MVGVDLQGMPVREKEIRVRFSILKDTETGLLTYREQHLVTTDAYGLFNTIIGQGIEDASPNTFEQIDWGTGFHFLKVEIDITGGTEYKDMGTQQLWSVPYALYSKYADTAGNGIEAVTDNGDGTITFTYLDGSTYTTPTLTGLTGPQGDTGPQGPQGDTGNGIVNTLDNGDGTFTFEYADGTTFTTSDLTGQQGIQGVQGPIGATGPQGATGNGIASTTDNGDGTFTFTYDDGTTFTTSDLTGPQGIQGIQGVAGANGTNGLDGNGIASTTDNGDGTFTFTYDDGSTFTTSDLTGPQGIQGIQGVAGANGTNGLDGNGIASTTDNGDGTFTFTYDDGSTFTTSDLTGPQGATGSQGPQGVQGPAGANGTNGTNGLDGNGIASTTDNGDGTFTFTYDDGSSFTTSDLTGPQGTQGPAGTNGTNGLDGNGIASTTDNGDGTFTFTYDDGSTFTTSDLTGPQGAQGPQGIQGPAGTNGTNGLDGNGIASTTDNGDGTFTFTYDDGTTFTTSDLTGPAGSQDAWSLTGNAGTDPATNFIGSTDVQDLVVKTNDTERVRVLSTGEVGIGATPDASAKLEVASSSQGFLPPRLTSIQRDAIVSPSDGLIIFNTTSGCPNYFYDGTWYEWCGTGVLPIGVIGALNCGSATNNGTLTEGEPTSGVSSEISYTGGNGGTYNGQTVNSTGITGLTATLNAGTFANGSGSLTYTISGTPNSSGAASFVLSIGGQTCNLNRTVDLPIGAITSLNCASATNNGTLTEGEPASGVSSEISYTGGNGGTFNGQTVNSTGVTGLTATLVAGTFANGTGTITYTITGAPSAPGTASFTLNIGGVICDLNVQVLSNIPAVGDFFQGGVVFYVDGNGNGLIAAPYDQSTTAAWGCQGTATGSTPTNIGSGNQNTLDILNGCSGSPAANLCVNLNISGYNDWYLPSKDELNLMFQNRATINATANLNGGSSLAIAWYWSSSEFNQFTAWHQNFFNGVQAPNQYFKGNTLHIRAIRSF
jgi:hypothetical protein